MWEIELISSREHSAYLSYIYEAIKNDADNQNVLCAFMSDENFVYLSLGCKAKQSAYIKAKLRITLADVICNQLKFDFLQSHIDKYSDNEILYFILIKICTYFDTDFDRQIILQSINLDDKKLNIDSYFYFKLNNLKNKWLELCKVTNSNSNLIINKDNYLDFLKFLLSNIDKKCKSVIIRLEENCLVYHDEVNDVDAILNIDLHNETDFLGKLIELNPYFIKIYTKQHKLEMIEILKSIFTDVVVVS